MSYDPSDDSRKSYDLAVAANREKLLLEIPGVKRARVIGRCELLQGDCLEIMPHLERVDAILADPPYLLSDAGPGDSHFGMSLAKFEGDKYRSLTKGVDFAALFSAFSMICSPVNGFAFCSNKQVSSLMAEAEGRGLATTLLVWHKTNAAPFANGVWRGDIEYIVHFRGKGATFNGGAVEKTKVLPHPIVQDPDHPTVKPQGILQRLLRNCSDVDDVVLDPFLGSGSTLVACAKLGRRGIGIELDEGYFDIAVKRVTEAYRQPDLFVSQPAPAPIQEGFDL